MRLKQIEHSRKSVWIVAISHLILRRFRIQGLSSRDFTLRHIQISTLGFNIFILWNKKKIRSFYFLKNISINFQKNAEVILISIQGLSSLDFTQRQRIESPLDFTLRRRSIQSLSPSMSSDDNFAIATVQSVERKRASEVRRDPWFICLFYGIKKIYLSIFLKVYLWNQKKLYLSIFLKI